MASDIKYIGYLKYTGGSVSDGLLDARKSAEALLGFDEIIRYFATKKEPELNNINFEIPVRVKKGTWSALIPDTIGQWILTAGGVYFTTAAAQASKVGIMQTGTAKDITAIIKFALKAAQWMIKISKHVGSTTKKHFENTKFRNDNQEIGLPNEKGEFLFVPKEILDLYIAVPKKLFSKSCSVIEEDRNLAFGIIEDGEEKEVVEIDNNNKEIFYSEDDNEDTLFPELKHGQAVELEGENTRATESTNPFGFRYNDHVLVCRPENGSIADYKDKVISQEDEHFFPKVKMMGFIDRIDKFGNPIEKRPRIIFTNINSLETAENNDKQKLL